MKDIILISLLMLALCGLWFAHIQNKKSKEELKKMIVDLDSLQKAEESLLQVNEK